MSVGMACVMTWLCGLHGLTFYPSQGKSSYVSPACLLLLLLVSVKPTGLGKYTLPPNKGVYHHLHSPSVYRPLPGIQVQGEVGRASLLSSLSWAKETRGSRESVDGWPGCQ